MAVVGQSWKPDVESASKRSRRSVIPNAADVKGGLRITTGPGWLSMSDSDKSDVGGGGR